MSFILIQHAPTGEVIALRQLDDEAEAATLGAIWCEAPGPVSLYAQLSETPREMLRLWQMGATK